jgi:hypothetical protein
VQVFTKSHLALSTLSVYVFLKCALRVTKFANQLFVIMLYFRFVSYVPNVVAVCWMMLEKDCSDIVCLCSTIHKMDLVAVFTDLVKYCEIMYDFNISTMNSSEKLSNGRKCMVLSCV